MLKMENQQGVRILVLDRPPVNALTLESLIALRRAMEDAAGDSDCLGVVVTGANACFSGGIDVKALPSYTREQSEAAVLEITRLVVAGYALDKPLVAALSGHTIGAGMILALMADWRVVARGNFRMGLTEAAAGLPFPLGALEIVRAELPPDLARRLAIGSATHPIDAPMFANVIDATVDAADLLPAALAEVRRLVAMPGFALVKAQYRRDTRTRLAAMATGRDPLLDMI